MIRSLLRRRTLEDEINSTPIKQDTSINNNPIPNIPKRPSKLSYLTTTVAALFASIFYANATPVWTNLSDTVTEEYYDNSQGKNVRRFAHQVKNISTEGESLKEYIYPAGSDQGIIHAFINSDYDNDNWAPIISSNQTRLSAIGAANEKGPTQTAVFKFLTTDLDEAGDTTGPAKGLDSVDIPFHLNTSSGPTNMSVNIPGTIIYNNIVVSSGANGSVDKEGANPVPYGGSLDMMFLANLGYELNNVKTNGTAVAGLSGGSSNDWTWANITAPGTVDASYRQITVHPSNGTLFRFN
jgi:hypothetical protein